MVVCQWGWKKNGFRIQIQGEPAEEKGIWSMSRMLGSKVYEEMPHFSLFLNWIQPGSATTCLTGGMCRGEGPRSYVLAHLEFQGLRMPGPFEWGLCSSFRHDCCQDAQGLHWHLGAFADGLHLPCSTQGHRFQWSYTKLSPHGPRRHLLPLGLGLGLRPGLWVSRAPLYVEATNWGTLPLRGLGQSLFPHPSESLLALDLHRLRL